MGEKTESKGDHADNPSDKRQHAGAHSTRQLSSQVHDLVTLLVLEESGVLFSRDRGARVLLPMLLLLL